MSLSVSNQVTVAQIKEARNRLWNAGELKWKLDATQRKLYDHFHSLNDKTIIVNASRRLGKSYYLLTLALEQCIKYPKSIVKYIQPTKDMIRENLNPDFEIMLDDCPLELRPVFKTLGNVWVFPNGSRINLAGTDGKNYNKLRGGNAHLCLVDEAGFCSDLKHIINSILIPTTTLTKGRIVLSSTTPPDPDHEFVKYMEHAEQTNTLIRKTILDAIEDGKAELNPRITEETVADIIKSLPGGVENQSFKTEYLCEVIFNSSDAVVPEFSKEVQEETIVEWPKPAFYDRYVSMDIGFEDLTVILFAIWDFDNSVLYVEDEIVLKGHDVTSRNIAEKVAVTEKKLWMNRVTGEIEEPYMRISDNNLILLNDLSRDHGLYFTATDKHNKEAFINKLRNFVRDHRIIINPRCVTMISHLKSATWDKSRKSYKRSPDSGHYDAVDALAYLVRNIDESRNPYPKGYKYSLIGPSHQVHIRDHELETGEHSNAEFNKLKKMFDRKSSFTTKK